MPRLPRVKPSRFAGLFDRDIQGANTFRERLIFPILEVAPRAQDQAGASAVLTVNDNRLLEVGYVTNAPTISYLVDGLSLATNAADKSGWTLEPLVGVAALKTILVTGHATRGSGASTGWYATGAANADAPKNPYFWLNFKTGGSIAAQDIAAGFQTFTVTPGPAHDATTAVTTTIATGAYFWYNPTTSANWQAVIKGANVYDTGIPVVASTAYEMYIGTNAGLTVDFVINGKVVVQPSTRITVAASTNITPFVGCRTNEAVAKTHVVRGLEIGRQW